MFTYKQLEALYWIAELGGFAAAARKLNTTQSAISKRVQELERREVFFHFSSARLTWESEEDGWVGAAFHVASLTAA